MKMSIAALAAVALALGGSPALAGHGEGKGHDKHEGKFRGDDGYQRDDDGPPGLAKKPYGLPPGQAKKMWRRGAYIPRAYYAEPRYVVVEPVRYRLRPPPPGYRWVLVEDDAYLVRRDNGLIADIVGNAVANLLR